MEEEKNQVKRAKGRPRKYTPEEALEKKKEWTRNYYHTNEEFRKRSIAAAKERNLKLKIRKEIEKNNKTIQELLDRQKELQKLLGDDDDDEKLQVTSDSE